MFPGKLKKYFFHLKAQNGCGTQLISYPVGTGSFFPDSKPAEASSVEVKNQWSEAFSSPHVFISFTGTNLSFPLPTYPTREGRDNWRLRRHSFKWPRSGLKSGKACEGEQKYLHPCRESSPDYRVCPTRELVSVVISHLFTINIARYRR